MNSHFQYSIIGPAMNEAGNLQEYVRRCCLAFSQKDISFEIIIVDDGSTDHTQEIFLDLKSEYHGTELVLLTHRRNFGLTSALKTAFDKSRGERIIWISTDLESLPDEDIPKFIQGFDEGADVVVGFRLGRGDGKSPASLVYNFVCRKLFGLQLRDMNWCKAFKRECLEHLVMRSDWHRFIVVMLYSAGFEITEKEMNWYPRKYGISKFGLTRFPIAMIDAVGVYFFLKFSLHPMRLFGGLGALFALTGLSLIFGLSAYFFVTGTQLRPLFWTGLVFLMFALNLVLVGFLAEVAAKPDEKSRLRK